MSENQNAPSRGSPPGIPRWVKLFVIIFIAVILLVVILHLMGFGFGGHGANGAEGTISGGIADYTLHVEHALQQP